MTASTISDSISATSRAYDTALESGLRFQQESADWLGRMMDTVRLPYSWQSSNGAVLDKIPSAIRKNVDESVRLMQENLRFGMEFYEKMLGAGSEPSNPEGKACLAELWRIGLRAMRTNAEAAVQAQALALGWWADLAESLGKAARKDAT